MSRCHPYHRDGSAGPGPWPTFNRAPPRVFARLANLLQIVELEDRAGHRPLTALGATASFNERGVAINEAVERAL